MQLRAAVFDRAPGQHVEPHQQGVGLGPDMRLDIADQHVDALFGHLAAGFEHGVRLAHARRRAEEDLQLAARVARFFGLHAGQQGIGVGSDLRPCTITQKRIVRTVPARTPTGSCDTLRKAVCHVRGQPCGP